MLPRSRRIFTERDYRRVGRTGRARRGRLLHVRFVNNGLLHNRFGIIVGKRVSKKATDRNRLKRQLRHLVSRLPKTVEHCDVVIVVQPTAKKITSAQLLHELSSLLNNKVAHETPRSTRH